MDTRRLLDVLGYTGSPNCLRGRELSHAPDYGHVFRRASESAGLDAVYCVDVPAAKTGRSVSASIPVSYVCKAESFEEADRIHRLVWNQNVVPFLIVLAPQGVRLYAGFERQRGGGAHSACFIETDLDGAATQLAALTSNSIDSGMVWGELGDRVRLQQRVEWQLLSDLEALEKILKTDGLRDSVHVHTLIGKLLYLHYLRHRDILSDARLEKWGLSWSEVAGRSVKIAPFMSLCTHLDDWLNGSVFPITDRMMRDIGLAVLQRAAGVFAGDSSSGQMHLEFDAYDFSYIPIETLSVVYEQFLHLSKTPSGESVGREQGAYYTPIPVVNFMLDRMDEIKPLRPGMRVLDPSCGSGAFLVQCYRKLIEERLRKGPPPRPPELRGLLVEHIFGMDVNAEACRVAEFSLLLTMLDYIDPPDLTTTNFRLPSLSGANIVTTNAFDDANEFVGKAKKAGFDWIVGNPPWKDLKGSTTDAVNQPVLKWMLDHKTDKPTGGNQAAEAFAWRTQELSAKNSAAALLLPAMVLFKDESKAFRQAFFKANPLAYVANFANLAEVLFAGRSRVPAAALVFRPGQGALSHESGRLVPVFSPLVANQEVTRPRTQGTRVDTWSIVVNENECRPVDRRDIETGEPLVWKLAAWGSDLDRTILRRASGVPSLQSMVEAQQLTISEGLQLRRKAPPGGERVEHHPDLAGCSSIDVPALAGQRNLFAFPAGTLVPVAPEDTYVRAGRHRLPESVSRPPHVIVSAARNWAVFSDEYIVVPPRQIGIAGPRAKASLLKALALYLNSDFVQYHQFFVSTQVGVQRKVSTLAAFRALPIPRSIADADAQTMTAWASLHDDLVECDVSAHEAGSTVRERRKGGLLRRMNVLVNAALNLREPDAVRVSDFVNTTFGLRDGKVEPRAVRIPDRTELQNYAKRLQHELNVFVGAEAGVQHSINVWTDTLQGVVQIDLQAREAAVVIHPQIQQGALMSQVAAVREELESRFSQWRYFNRNLQLFVDDRVYLFKPLQRFHWMESQAILDAREVIGLVLEQTRGAS
jgi:hypothetical protein